MPSWYATSFYFVGTWHFVCWPPVASSCGYLVFWWPHSVLVGTQDFFWWAAGISFAGHVSSCWARGIFFSRHLPYFWPCGICFGEHLAFCWAPSMYFGEHQDLVRTQPFFWWPCGILVVTWHRVGHPVFIFLGT